MKLKENKGITLIALIVTVIILIILAGISVGVLTGDNGIIKNAGEAKKGSEISGEETLLRTIAVKAMEREREGKLTEERLKNQTNKHSNIKSVISLGNAFVVEFNSGNKYMLNNEGNVKLKNGLLANEITKNDIGNYVFNYSDIDIKDGGEVQKADWQLFYSGKVSNESEDHIYLIASNLLNYDSLPKSKAGNTLNIGNSQYHANWGSILNDYPNGPDDVEQETRYLNSNYFEFLSVNNLTNDKTNIRNVAYMCDTTVWNKFKTDKADFVIGGPTIELLFKSINKKYETNCLAGSIQYNENAVDINGNPVQSVTNLGCLLSENGGETWYNGTVSPPSSTDRTYLTPNEYFWLASTSTVANMVFRVGPNGRVLIDSYLAMYDGFRPIVRLKADVQLEEVEGGYRIIE